MKFGDTLQQRSVPEWSSYNVDYNELKQMIKARTDPDGRSEPVSIPGQGDPEAALVDFENQFFHVLCQQLERVNTFTKSKYGEFERRMDYVDRQARLLRPQRNDFALQLVQYTRRYQKLAKEVEGVGEDTQSLTRYVATQKQAFRKLLKKYRKWTSASGLELRMNNEAFNQPDSVFHMGFSPLLDRLERVRSNLATVSQPGGYAPERIAPDPGQIPTTRPQKPKSSAARLHDEYLLSSPLKFDAAFSAVPPGIAGGRATYWVHQDHLDEVTVLLRRYMKNGKGSTPPVSSRRASVTSLPLTRQESIQSNIATTDRIHVSMFDNLQRFNKAHEAVSSGQADDLVGAVSSVLAMSILWTKEPEAVVVTADLSPSASPVGRQMEIGRMKSKDLVRLFAPEHPSESTSVEGSVVKSLTSDAGLQVYRGWLAHNRDIRPLVEVQSTRCRFAGVNNTSEVGTWALMDTDITMFPTDLSTVGRSSATDVVDAQNFPHTVLEVRWEFSRTPEIVRALDNTHLVQRARGFSLEAHAISTICKPADTPLPTWQSLLSEDIRKIPPLLTQASRRKYVQRTSSSGPSSTDCPSPSVNSESALHSSATSHLDSAKSTPSKGSLISQQRALAVTQHTREKRGKRKVHHEPPAVQRYWNEFDDEDELREDDSYAIYVNPDDNPAFPGAETVSKAFASMYQSLGRTKHCITFWLPLQWHHGGRDHDVEEGVRQPLLGSINRGVDPGKDESSDTDTSTSPARPKTRRSLVHPNSPSQRKTYLKRTRHRINGVLRTRSGEVALFRTYLGFFIVAIILLLVSTILKVTGKHREEVEVDAGVIVGVVASLGSAVTGISLMVSREEQLSWLHWLCGAGAFLAICVGSGWLLAVVGSNL